jgi:hypothetical protein
VATAPNQVWSLDITFLPSAIRGQFYQLYMIVDVYSRMIVSREIHAEESAQHAAMLIEKACLWQGVHQDKLVLHSNNGSPMKDGTMLLATLQWGLCWPTLRQGVQAIVGEQVAVQMAKRSELHTLKVMPKRWVVERSFAWPEKHRRLWKNAKRKLNSSLQFIHLAFLALLLRRL